MTDKDDDLPLEWVADPGEEIEVLTWDFCDHFGGCAHCPGISTPKTSGVNGPVLFNDPILSGLPHLFGGSAREVKRPIFAPLAGEDLFVSEEILKQYADGVEAFFEEIAAYLDAHETEPY